METLLELVDEIKAELGQSYDHRLQAAIKMAEACKLFDKKDPAAEGMTWTKFAMKHFDLSSSEVKKLVKIGSSDNPKQAMADHREEARNSAAKSRKLKQENGSDMGAPAKAGADGGGDSSKPNGEKSGSELGTIGFIILAYAGASGDVQKSFLQWLHDEFGYKIVPPDPPVTREAMHPLPAQAGQAAA